MKKAYIVLAHKAPRQLARLIRALEDGSSRFFIHLDRSCDAGAYKHALAGQDHWQLLKAEDGGWGKCGIVKATLNGLKSIEDCGDSFDVIHLVSGQDYPIRSNFYADLFFERNQGKIFLEFFPLPADVWPEGGMDRIYEYHFGDRRRRSRVNASRWITRFCNTVFLKRRFPAGLVPYGGWQWWSMPMPVVSEILRFVERRPNFLLYHRHSLLPDEMFFQTILLNSESDSIRKNLVNNCLRFVDWDNPNPSTPATLTAEYFDALIDSKSLFARKFDPVRDDAILDKLDAFRAEEERVLLKQQSDGAIEIELNRSADAPRSPAWPGTKINLLDSPLLCEAGGVAKSV